MEDLRLYDFKRSEKFSVENLKHLTMLSEELCRISNMQISYEAKSENITLKMGRTEQNTYSEFIEMIDRDSVVIEYTISPLVENLTLFIDKIVVLSLVDLLMGGNGQVTDINREPTNIDLELLKHLFENLLNRIYIPYKYDTVDIFNIYTGVIQYQKLNNKDIIFNSSINVLLEEKLIGNIRFCIPYKSMEPIVNVLVNNNIKEQEKLEDNISSNEAFDFIKNVDVDICAKFASTKVRVNDLLNLENGDVIIFDQKIVDDITISIGDADIYKARLGVLGMKKGIEITDIINRER